MKPLTPKQELRKEFNGEAAPKIAAAIGAPPRREEGSARFAYFGDDQRLVVVAGAQEEAKVDLALAYGLTYRGERDLVLVLPAELAFPTLQRAAWLKAEAQPSVYLHDGAAAVAADLPTQPATVKRLEQVRPSMGPEEELRDAATPLHLGKRSTVVVELVEWATGHPLLDPGHRRGQRSWHCMGQRVLSIQRRGGRLEVRAGIHTIASDEPPLAIPDADGPLTEADWEAVRAKVADGIAARLSGPYRRADEYWLQAVIRRDPTLVGVEQPALRELPAWRPVAKPLAKPGQDAWGRGLIDLAGIDGHGDLRIVETKLTRNQDELLFLQGLDYYVWAQAYRHVLGNRLGAPKGAEVVVHYVIGDDPVTGAVAVSKFAAAQAAALDIPWRLQTVTDWYRGPDEPGRSVSELLPPGKLPP